MFAMNLTLGYGLKADESKPKIQRFIFVILTNYSLVHGVN